MVLGCLQDILIGHSPDFAVQVTAVHPRGKDPLIIFPSGIDRAVDVSVHHLPVVLPVQTPLCPLSGEAYALCILFPVCRDPVSAPEAGL